MRILVTGGHGQLGTALEEVLKNEETLFTDTDNMDITDKNQVEKTFVEFKPEILIHGAALTNVDGCEENADLAYKINAEGTANLADECEKNNCLMIYISTDYVFDGTKKTPYVETDEPNPINEYGKNKLGGEKAVEKLDNYYILRTSWVYGGGHNFVRTMIELAKKMDEIKVVNDQFGRPTYALDLAKAIYDVIKNRPKVGIYNVTGDGEIISWAEFAEEIFKIAGFKTKVTGILTDEYFAGYPGKKIASRPKNSALDLSQSIQNRIFIATWSDSLKDFLSK